ncbi:hypothetical protein PAE0235 [Pyrobaculum aerophilum str. IM2]|uniref:Uncharacterized protein n=1 Tax=Pyrobaculum aerophilum (strain ATCC 51768 / DSM 7523 / JCM 9630 / CIP 104966 / NBRC 100827 / IM2) TaxID=178306 RepID=Q8ZZJ1_PYRAE|nr:hypothetical protein PAE0235 [Pyrobaculum aerophilum str. IM2]
MRLALPPLSALSIILSPVALMDRDGYVRRFHLHVGVYLALLVCRGLYALLQRLFAGLPIVLTPYFEPTSLSKRSTP